MSTPLNVERDEIIGVAAVYDATADVIDSVGQSVARCTFDGPMAGRKYADSGVAVHGGYTKVVTSLQECTTGAHAIATALRAAAGLYAAGDSAAATDLTGQR